MPRQHLRPNIKGPAAPKLPTFRSKLAKAQREGGVVVQVTWGDLIKTVHVATKHFPSETAWNRFCTVFAGIPQGVLCATSGINWPDGLMLGPERIAMLLL